jgi:hypothetical protein
MKRIFLLFCGLIPSLSSAQQYSIDWYKVADGGGPRTKSQYSKKGSNQNGA